MKFLRLPTFLYMEPDCPAIIAVHCVEFGLPCLEEACGGSGKETKTAEYKIHEHHEKSAHHLKQAAKHRREAAGHQQR
jgi:hypothetical protein